MRATFERGAAGYLVKTAPVADILEAVRTVASGGTAFSAAAVRSVRSAPRRPSDREIAVLALVGAGASNAEAARYSGLSEKTIESHLRRLFDRVWGPVTDRTGRPGHRRALDHSRQNGQVIGTSRPWPSRVWPAWC